jgi:hypothetical protein
LAAYCVMLPFYDLCNYCPEGFIRQFVLNKSELYRKTEVILSEGCYYKGGWCICKKWEIQITVTDEDCIHIEIMSRLNSDNAYFSSFQNILSSYLLSRNLKSKIYNTTVLHIVCGNVKYLSSFSLREEHRERVFWEGSAKENISSERWNKRRMEKICNWELHKCYSSPNIRVIKCKRMSLVRDL